MPFLWIDEVIATLRWCYEK